MMSNEDPVATARRIVAQLRGVSEDAVSAKAVDKTRDGSVMVKGAYRDRGARGIFTLIFGPDMKLMYYQVLPEV